MVETLPSMARLTLITYDQHRTQRSKPWSWKRLLPRIALDLTIFRFMLCKGPAGCDLLGTDDPLGGTPFASLKLSARIVREIYCSYQSYTSSLFGSELVLNNSLLPTFHRLGYSFGKEVCPEQCHSLPAWTYAIGTRRVPPQGTALHSAE
jgi:hypothetical protein